MDPLHLLQQLSAESSPLSSQQLHQLQQLVGQLDPMQQAWISGYLAAVANAASDTRTYTGDSLNTVGQAAASLQSPVPLTILYGSQTGNAKGVANQLKVAAEARGLAVKLIDMADYKVKQLKDEKFIAIAVSTYGEGEPPESAESLHQFLISKKAPPLGGLNAAVIGLGDSSYEFFCQTAIDFEQRLTALGATTLVSRVDLDVDYEQQAKQWIDDVLDAFEAEFKDSHQQSAQVIPLTSQQTSISQYSKHKPFQAELLAVQKITGRDSVKDIRHIEISLEDSAIRYQPGDSLGVFFHNDETRVDQLLLNLALSGDERVTLGDDTTSIRQALIEQLELSQSYPGFVERYAALSQSQTLECLLSDKADLRGYLRQRQIFDIVAEQPAPVSAQGFIDCLRKLQPRLYSIASSQQEVEDEVHLTVGLVTSELAESQQLGGCSSYLTQRAIVGSSIAVYVEPNEHFRLPSDDLAPVIMIGPGTGIAPFRAFLQERECRDAKGENWLFFGNPHFTQDFLYQTELQHLVKTGVLNKIDLAFSRDQEQKIYVQDRLVERGAELFAWLERGAYLYVCGDAKRMAKDVHQSLIEIIQCHGKKGQSAAEQYLQQLKAQRRYQKDVY